MMQGGMDAAIERDDVEQVRTLARSGFVLNVPDQDGDMQLHKAKSMQVAEILLQYGADVNARNLRTETPLHTAIILEKGLPIVQKLLAFGADVNAILNMPIPRIDIEPITPIVLATFFNQNFVILELLNRDDLRMDETVYSSLLMHQPFNAAYYIFHQRAKRIINTFLLDTVDDEERNFTVIRKYTQYPPLRAYTKTIVNELVCLKRFASNRCRVHKLNKLSLYEDDKLYLFYNKLKIFKDSFATYGDLFLQRIDYTVVRRTLLRNLDTMTLSDDKNRVVLPSHCLHKISQHLDNQDLNNLVKALNL